MPWERTRGRQLAGGRGLGCNSEPSRGILVFRSSRDVMPWLRAQDPARKLLGTQGSIQRVSHMRFQEGEGRPGNTWGMREAGAPNTAIIGAPPKKPPEGFPEGSNTASVEPWSLPLPQQLAVTSRRGIWGIGGFVGVPLWRPRGSEEARAGGVYVFVFAAAWCLESFRWKNTSLFAIPHDALNGV